MMINKSHKFLFLENHSCLSSAFWCLLDGEKKSYCKANTDAAHLRLISLPDCKLRSDRAALKVLKGKELLPAMVSSSSNEESAFAPVGDAILPRTAGDSKLLRPLFGPGFPWCVFKRQIWPQGLQRRNREKTWEWKHPSLPVLLIHGNGQESGLPPGAVARQPHTQKENI